MISVVIPAHNEEAVIGRCLQALTEGAKDREVEILVVCNGCSDNTAKRARSFGGPVRVIETETASKTHALNLGDEAARGFPRFYVDADVELPLSDLRRLAARLDRGDALAVGPRFRMELEGCSRFVRAFYDINDRLPSSGEGIGGSGVYGLSEAGRRRFGQFPRITADDGFVRVQFAPHERASPEDCRSGVYAPRTLADLIRIKTRSHLGSTELRMRFPDLWTNRGPGNGKTLKRLMLRPWLWPRLAVYGFVKLAARGRSRRMIRSGRPFVWERGETSRALNVNEHG